MSVLEREERELEVRLGMEAREMTCLLINLCPLVSAGKDLL